MPEYHYVICRADLPLGTLCAQIVHAAGESGPASPGTHAVVLSVPNEAALELVEERLRTAKVRHVAIREPDSPWSGAIMAIGISPTDASYPPLHNIVRRLPLIKEKTK
jgi:hypothetical protein